MRKLVRMTSVAGSAIRPSIRYRSHTGLRFFDPARNAADMFRADEARYDHERLRVRGIITIPQFIREDIGAHGLIEVLDGRLDGRRLECSGNQSPWSVSIDGNDCLYSARGKVWWAEHRGGFEFSLDLDLNLTRFVAHRSEAPHDSGDPLARNPTIGRSLARQTLDGNDNVLIGADRLGGQVFARRREWWRSWSVTYHDLVLEDLVRCLTPEGFGIQAHIERVTLVKAEIYWEFSHTDATSVVSRLSHEMASADGATRQFYSTAPIQSGQERNAHWSKIALNRAVHLKLYAKTPTRIRVELVYQARIREHARVQCSAEGANIISLLDGLAQDAEQRAVQAVGGLAALMQPSEECARLVTALANIAKRVRGSDLTAVLSLLAAGPIEPTSDDGLLPRRTCSALVRDGVLQRVSLRFRSRQYRLLPALRRVFQPLPLAAANDT